jgi:hypothetical protein
MVQTFVSPSQELITESTHSIFNITACWNAILIWRKDASQSRTFGTSRQGHRTPACSPPAELKAWLRLVR